MGDMMLISAERRRIQCTNCVRYVIGSSPKGARLPKNRGDKRSRHMSRLKKNGSEGVLFSVSFHFILVAYVQPEFKHAV